MIDKLQSLILHLQKAIPSNFEEKSLTEFSEFQITIEATHHGPTGPKLNPTIFIEIGTTEKQWNDVSCVILLQSLVTSSDDENQFTLKIPCGYLFWWDSLFFKIY